MVGFKHQEAPEELKNLQLLRYPHLWKPLYPKLESVGPPSYKLVYNPIKSQTLVIVVINQLSYLGGPTL